MFESTIFLKRLKEARLRLGISQKELGIRVGMDPGSASGRMNHYEKGRHVPDLETMERIAKELGVPVAYLLCEKDSMAELVCILDKMSEEDRQVLIRQLSERDT